MTRNVATVDVHADVAEAAATMMKPGVRGLPVTDEWGHVHGLVALDDLVRHVGHEAEMVRRVLWLGSRRRNRSRSGSAMPAHTVLIDIDPEDCADLLGCAPIGRLGVVVQGEPEIFLSTMCTTGRVAAWCSRRMRGPSSTPRSIQPAVAFEVDCVSPEGDRGWSVLVVGRAEEITDPDTIARVARLRTVLWRTENRVHWLRIVPSRVRAGGSSPGPRVHVAH